MANIYLVRHGRTENKDNIVYGRMPGFILSKEGEEEAKKAGEYLADKRITQIYTSPLERAFQTANIISSSVPNIPITHSFDLTEVESTSWQGLRADEVFKNDLYEHFINDPEAQIGSENLNQLAARMKRFIQQTITKHPGENIICVSHEFPILALKLSLENKPLKTIKTYRLPTGSTVLFKFDQNGVFLGSEIVDLPESSLPKEPLVN